MEVLDTNDVAVGGIFEITLEVAWVNLDPPGSGIECVDAWEQGASIYQGNVDGLIPENATLSWWRFSIPETQDIDPWNPTTNNPILNQDPAEFEVTITVIDNR